MVLRTPTLALKTFEVVRQIGCIFSSATLDTVFAKAPHAIQLFRPVENPDSGDDIVFFFVVALTEDPTRFGRNLATPGAG